MQFYIAIAMISFLFAAAKDQKKNLVFGTKSTQTALRRGTVG